MPYPLEGFFQKASNMHPVNPKLVDPNFDQLNRNAFKQAIPAINQMDEHSLSVLIKNNLEVKLLGWTVNVEWNGSTDNKEKDVFLSGPADYVFKAELV